MKAGELDWDDLRYLLAVIRHGSLAGAARALGVRHTTIGRRIAAFERSIGGLLIVRRPDGVELTPLGEALVPRLEEVERAAHAVLAASAATTANVRLAMPSGYSQFFLRPLERLRASHPAIAVDILSGSRHVDLQRSEADLALRVGPTADSDLVTRAIGDTAWSMYASDAYLARRGAPADPRDLAGHDLISFDPCLAAIPGASWMHEHGAGGQIVMRCRELPDVLAATAAGLGLAVLSCLSASTEPALRRLTPEILGTRKLSLVYRREAMHAVPVRIVTQLVMDTMRAHADAMSGLDSNAQPCAG
jgi:DNA-binding transcriptional LysR family regulator